jgi:predicted dehydrogenase
MTRLSNICRWGILGTAEIARKNWLAIYNAPNGTLKVVASRDLGRSQRFIDECQQHVPFDIPPIACASYEELLANDAIDAVYIPLPTGIRTAWAIRAAEAGKHILVEKPVGVTSQDVSKILAACKQNQVQFMDGVMFVHSQRMQRIQDILNDGQTVGELKRISCQFADGEASEDAFADNIRANSKLEPLGCLGDLGWYAIRFILWALNWELPVRVTGHLLDEYRHPASPAAVPTDFSAELFFASGVSATFYCSFVAQIHQWVNLAGTKGTLHVPDFVLPRNGDELLFDASNSTFAISGCDFIMEEHTQRFAVQEHSHSNENAQETNMFRHFSDLVISGQLDDTWGTMSLKTQKVLDACFESACKDGCVIPLPD